MNICFITADLEDLYYLGKGHEAYSEAVFRGFSKKILLIENAKDESELRAIKGNHFEKIKGEKNLFSIRINGQFRLMFSFDGEGDDKKILIKEISNHYS